MNKENVKWHQLSADAAVKQLHTNASCGLSRKEARSRYRKLGANTLFDTPQTGKASLLKPILTDPSLLLLFFACILSICFSEVTAGVSTLICLMLGLIFSVRLLLVEKRLAADVAKYRIPTVCVVREGKEYLTSAQTLVPGDIVLLKKGDVVPCDCRLLYTEKLFVLTLQPDQEGKPSWTVTQKNADAVYPYGAQVVLPNPENMVYGASEILDGEARALVVETGGGTFLGGMKNYAIPAEAIFGKKRDGVSCVLPYLRFYTFALFVLLLPLTVIGMLTAPEDHSILSIFLSLSALLGTGSQILILIHFQTPITHLANKRFREAQRETRVILKSARAAERLSSLTDIFVIGHCGITDGKLHFYRCATGGGEQSVGDQASRLALQSLCEAFVLLGQAKRPESYAFQTTAPQTDLSTFRKELLIASGYDAEALQVRLLSVRYYCQGEYGEDLLDVEMKEQRYRLLFSERTGWITHCTYFEHCGKIAPLSEPLRNRLKDFVFSAKAEGCRLKTVLKQENDRLVLLGIVALREQTQSTLPSVLEELNQSGVRVSFFLPKESAEELFYATATGYHNKCITASQAIETSKKMPTFIEKHRVFIGFDHHEIKLLLKELKNYGNRVAILGTDAEDLALMRSASLAVTCDPLLYHKQKEGFLLEREVLADTDTGASSALRRYADVLIHRAARLEGGLSAMLQIISDCRASDYRFSLILKFLISSQILRLVPTLLSVIFGVGLMSGAQLLFSGILCETVCVLWLLSLFIPQNRLRKPHAFSQMHAGRILKEKERICSAVAASLITSLYTVILFYCGVFTAEICVSFLFFAVLLMQLTALFFTAFSVDLHVSLRSALTAASVVLVPVILMIAFSVPFAAVNSVFLLGAWNLVSLLSLVLPPVFYMAFYILFLNIFYRTAK